MVSPAVIVRCALLEWRHVWYFDVGVWRRSVFDVRTARIVELRAVLGGRPVRLCARRRLRLALGRDTCVLFVQLSSQRRILRTESADQLLVLLNVILHRPHLVF